MQEETEVVKPAQARVKPSSRRIYLDPSTPTIRSIARVVIITLVIWTIANSALGIISSLTHLFFLIVLSVFFAYLIEPLVQMIRRPVEATMRDRLMPRTAAIATAYLLVFSVVGGLVTLLAPVITEQARQLTTSLPEYTNSLQAKFNQFNNRYIRYRLPEAFQTQINESTGVVISEIGTQVKNFVIGLVSYAPWLILIPVLAFFFLKDANLFRIQLLRLFPSGDWRTRVESVLHDVNKTLAAYVRAQLISCVLIGTLCAAAFSLLGVNYALLLGLAAGILEIIPLIGPLTLAVIAIAIASLESGWEAFYVFLFLGILRILQDYVFYPRIVREGIHLHPLAIILSVLAGEQVAGIPGVFLSIPVVALLTVLYRHMLEHTGNKGIITNILAPKETEIDKTLDATPVAINKT